MRALTGWKRGPGRGSDRGGVATLVAVLVGAGVLLGAGALAVDVGRLHAEREQLQTGADAAAVAVAENCVVTPASCASQDSVADDYAGLNANDGAGGAEVCGTLTGLTGCGPSATNLTACIGSPPTTPYAEVRTTTRRSDGTTLLPPAFARALSGDASEGSTVGACARATYGSPSSGTGLAVTLSTCEFNDMVAAGGYGPAPPAYPTSATVEQVIYLHGNKTRTCGAGNSGWDAPGGFGYLDEADECEATVSGGFVDGNTGSSASHDCSDALHELWSERRVVHMPVYDGVTGTGNNIRYHIAGFATFVVTGYKISGSDQEQSWLSHPAKVPCSGNDRCISGYFVRGLMPAGSDLGGGDFGTKVVRLVG
jgi:hypothetical protein